VEELIKLNPRYELQLEVSKEYQAIRSLPRGELNMYDVPEAKFTDASPSYSKAGKYYQ
jgi:hypothetical protein